MPGVKSDCLRSTANLKLFDPSVRFAVTKPFDQIWSALAGSETPIETENLPPLPAREKQTDPKQVQRLQEQSLQEELEDELNRL